MIVVVPIDTLPEGSILNFSMPLVTKPRVSTADSKIPVLVSPEKVKVGVPTAPGWP